MAVSLPYLATNKNLPMLLEKIASAKVPDTFSQNFLGSTIGLKGSNDRALIPFLRTLGFLDQSNAPTAAYRVLKGDKKKEAWAQGIRTAYRPLFDADESADELSLEKLKSLVAQVAGTDDAATARIAHTFTAAAKLGDFRAVPATPQDNDDADEEADDMADETDAGSSGRPSKKKALRPEFHYNIQVHLPSNGTEETYLNISTLFVRHSNEPTWTHRAFFDARSGSRQNLGCDRRDCSKGGAASIAYARSGNNGA